MEDWAEEVKEDRAAEQVTEADEETEKAAGEEENFASVTAMRERVVSGGAARIKKDLVKSRRSLRNGDARLETRRWREQKGRVSSNDFLRKLRAHEVRVAKVVCRRRFLGHKLKLI
jgi:hypothetical protein